MFLSSQNTIGLKLHMPPFEDEPAESSKRKPVPFLKQSLRGRQKDDSSLVPFGAEPAESSRGKPSLKVKKEPVKRPTVPFQDEGEESVSCHKKLKPTPGPLQREPAESKAERPSDSSSGSDFEEPKPPETPFSLGWEAAHRQVSGNFWKQNLDETVQKPKRPYDNSKRQANAAYVRKGTHGFFKSNGVDPARLEKLFGSPSCNCI